MKLNVENGKLVNSVGDSFETAHAHGTKTTTRGPRGMFVMDKNGRIYASTVIIMALFVPSSILAGQPVAAAGGLVVNEGVIKLITNCGMHYPSLDDISEQVVESLKRQGYMGKINYQQCSSPDVKNIPTPFDK